MPHLGRGGFDGPKGCPFVTSSRVSNVGVRRRGTNRGALLGSWGFTRELPLAKSHLGHDGPVSGHSRTMSGKGLKMSGKGMECPELRGWPTPGLPWHGSRYDGGAMPSACPLFRSGPALSLSNKILISNRWTRSGRLDVTD